MTDQTATETAEATAEEWVPQPCDPDAPLNRPENIREETWDLLSEFEKHTITQHVHPSQRFKTVEMAAFVTFASKMGMEIPDANALFAAMLLQQATDDMVLQATAHGVVVVAQISQQSMLENLLAQMRGDAEDPQG